MFKSGDLIVPKRESDTQRLMNLVREVQDVSGEGVIRTFPYGGGFVSTLRRPSAWRVLSRSEHQAMFDAPMARIRVDIDGIGPGFAGYTSGDLWNGWEVVGFELSEVRRILKSCEVDAIEKDGVFSWQFEDMDPETLEPCKGRRTVDGEKVLYFFDGWCWQEVKP